MKELGYEVSGEPGPRTILFLHGFMGSAADWRPVGVKLGGRFRFVAVDLPGHGASLGLSPGKYTMEGAARSLVRILENLDAGRTVVTGYSMGGRLALYFALRHPEYCRGLFLESASPGLESADEREQRRLSDEKLAKRLGSEDFEDFLRGWYSQQIFASLARNRVLLEQTIESRKRNVPEELARSLRGMGTGRQPPLWGELAGLQVPTLAVAGSLDEKFVGIGRRMETISPEVRFTEVSGAGHNVHAETPELYARLLQGFAESI